MAITLQYPIMTTHSNIVICHDKSVIAYYRIPNTPITITDDEIIHRNLESLQHDETKITRVVYLANNNELHIFKNR